MKHFGTNTTESAARKPHRVFDKDHLFHDVHEVPEGYCYKPNWWHGVFSMPGRNVLVGMFFEKALEPVASCKFSQSIFFLGEFQQKRYFLWV